MAEDREGTLAVLERIVRAGAKTACGLSVALIVGCGAASKDMHPQEGSHPASPASGPWWTAVESAAPTPLSIDDVSDGGAPDGPTKYTGDREVRALVRFRPSGASTTATFTFAQREVRTPDPGDPKAILVRNANFRLLLSGSQSPSTVSASVEQDDAPLFDPKSFEALPWVPAVSSSFSYRLRAFEQFLPGWPEELRTQIEHDMSELPELKDKWVAIRAELRKGSARFWLDDRLVAHKTDAAIDPEGTIRLELGSGAQVSRFETKALNDAAALRGYRPIEIAGYANARGLLQGAHVTPESLPPAGTTVVVRGIPFVFPGVNPEGHDHIDVGRSALRQANWTGYSAAHYGPMARWIGSAERDPVRIQLRVANGQFNALHLIAASDGEGESVPVVTAMFYRPGAGFAHSFGARAELASARSAVPRALPVTLGDGRKASLYLVTIPLDPGLLSSFGDMDIVEVELTKQVRLYRTYPDPISYGYHQAGLPSGVHVYAATLQETPVGFEWRPAVFGHVWQAPAQPSYTATLTNKTPIAQAGKLLVVTRSHDGEEETRREESVTLPAGGSPVILRVAVPVHLFGYHDIKATLTIAGQTWTEARSLVKLAPDTRSPRWTPGRGALFGFWSYGSGHGGPKAEHHVRVMTMAGARTSTGYPLGLPPEEQALVDRHWSRVPSDSWEVEPQPWAIREPHDPTKIAAFTKEILGKWRESRAPVPEGFRPDHVYLYAEPQISPRMTTGHPPEYWGERPMEPTGEEKERLKLFFNTSLIAAEAVRRRLPGLKIFLPWGDPGFVWPLLRGGFPKHLFDGSGLDVPGFERIPERQLHEQSIHRLYWVRKEYEKAGIPSPDLRFVEGIFVPTEPGAVSWREQMDIYHRWTLLSMAYGVQRFYSGWFSFDSADYYGAEHYGGCGIQGKIPHGNPKPAYAAYATMTDRLNEASFDGWVGTGSTSTFALRFKRADGKGHVYALWTLAGKRPVTLTLDGDEPVDVTDSMNNTRRVASSGGKVTLLTDPSVTYVTVARARVTSAAVGEPDHSDARPAEGAKIAADLGDGSWSFTSERDATLETNHWGMMHYAGRFTSRIQRDRALGNVLTTRLEKQDRVHELMPWYNVVRPRGPAPTLLGAPAKLGLWVKGASDWGRFIYVLRDAKGERWESIGAKNESNCDDVHSWSQFKFDGWRYLTFELPGHAGWDSFRKHGTTWWRSDGGDGIVDLPLRLEAIVVEQRSHLLYVNDVQPAASNEVSFGKLLVEYDEPADATAEAVRESRLRMPLPERVGPLPNPIADMARTGALEAPRILGIRPPEREYDGTRAHIDFRRVPGAKAYYLWVSAHADGQAAVNMEPEGIVPGQLVTGLRPGIELHYWLVYADKDGKLSRPSPTRTHVLVDTFKEK